MLQDTATQRHARVAELRKVTSIAQASQLYMKDRDRSREPGYSLDGAMRSPAGCHAFAPRLGDRGDDVPVKHILLASGYNPGAMNTVFTEQTRFARSGRHSTTIPARFRPRRKP
jgi:hypothetical protein